MGYLEASWSVLEVSWRHLGAVMEGFGGSRDSRARTSREHDKSQGVLRVNHEIHLRDNELRFVASSFVP